MLKNQKGVTLVALVITIIVLLILAAVSFTMIVGNNGILNRARQASNDTTAASQNETEAITNAEKYMNYVVDGTQE